LTLHTDARERVLLDLIYSVKDDKVLIVEKTPIQLENKLN